MATHSSTLAWRIPWTEEPAGLQSMGSQRVGHDYVTKHSTRVKTRRKGLFSRRKASKAVLPQDSCVGHRSLGPCTVLLGESTGFGLKLKLLFHNKYSHE